MSVEVLVVLVKELSVPAGAAAAALSVHTACERARWIGRCLSVCRRSRRLVDALSVPAGAAAAALSIVAAVAV